VVAASGLAILGIYRYGLLSPVKKLEVEEVSVVRLSPDGRAARATSYLGAISPAVDRLELAPPQEPQDSGGAPDMLPHPLLSLLPSRSLFPPGEVEPLPVPRTTIQVDATGALRLPEIALRPNGMRYFRCDYRLPLEPCIELLRETESGFRLRNLSPEPMRVYLLQDGKLAKWPIVEAGDVVGHPPALEWERLSTAREAWAGAQAQLGAGFVNSPFAQHGHYSERSSAGAGLPEDPVSCAAVAGGLWSIGTAGVELVDAADSRPEVAERLKRLEPRYLVACSRAPIFPAPGRIPKRNAVTLFVLELPPRASE
jgi:hypothetical protein